MNVTLRKVDGRVAVLIPESLAKGFSVGDRVEMLERPEGLLLSVARRRPKRPLDDIVAGLNPRAYRRHNRAFADDIPVGREIW